MAKKPLPPSQDDVVAHDNAMRWFVRSRRPGVDPQLVDLSGYNCNGRCSCPDFKMNMENILQKGLSLQDAVEAGVLKVRDYHAGWWDAATCYHIFSVRLVLAVAFAQKFCASKTRG